MSFINSSLYNLSKFFTKILSLLAGRNGHTVKNSYEFVDTIIGLKLDDDKCIMSFDVVSLFTKIPVDVAKSLIFELFSKDDCLQDCTKLCLKELMLGINMCLDQWFSTFLVEWNPNETFQRLEEPLCNNLISYAKNII